ncbi:MAG: hypothetical protein L0216_06905, partial [Planctomycetales bacterium]|nr:hypothetical protein [Planctomycetales bacterium]
IMPHVPELPDIECYLAALRPRIGGATFARARLRSPFLLRSVDPPISSLEGRRVADLRRLGKRIVLGLDDGLFLVLHLMIAGRLRWQARGAGVPGKIGLAALDFSTGTLVLTEASQKKRASLHVVRGEEGLRAHDPGGIEPLACSEEEFRTALARENHTLKRSLTDPRNFAGIGNSYSDEILHRARLSPVALTSRLSGDEVRRLHRATRETLAGWSERLLREAGEAFPEKVTAFREGMAVHGRFGKPCPECRAPVQRIRHAENETNYCPGCQTGGKVLADRSLSKLLKDDWPRTLEELEELRR